MKKEIKTILLALAILLISFVVFNSQIVDFLSKPSINTKATSGALSVTITIVSPTEPESSSVGLVTGSSGGGGGNPSISSEVIKEPEKKPEPVKVVGNLFELNLFIPKKYAELFPGEKIIAKIKILNIKRTGLTNINLEYNIEDTNKEILFKEYEAKTFDSTASFLKEIKLPLEIKPGYYMLIVKLQDQKYTAIAGYPFKVKDVYEKKKLSFAYLPNLILMISILFLLIFTIYKLSKNRKGKKIGLRKQKLFKELKGFFKDGKKRRF